MSAERLAWAYPSLQGQSIVILVKNDRQILYSNLSNHIIMKFNKSLNTAKSQLNLSPINTNQLFSQIVIIHQLLKILFFHHFIHKHQLIQILT